MSSSKYGSWTLDEIKNELRKRGAKLSGRKHELVDRSVTVSVSLFCTYERDMRADGRTDTS